MAKSFQFRLQSIVRLRERDRDEAADDLKKALQAKQMLQDQITSLQEERLQLNAVRVVANGGEFNPQRIIETHRYQMVIDGQVAHLNDQVSLVEQECQRRRAKLVKCEQAVRSLEKLKEKQLADWETDAVNKSQDALDQWSGFRYWSDKEV
jgi:flagellar FliJ protein